MVPYNTIKSILEYTDDGRALLEPHRHLVRKALQETVTCAQDSTIKWLHESVTSGKYRKDYFENIEHMTRDAAGLLFWKEHLIGSFSVTGEEQDHTIALKLAARCRQLEAKGFPLNPRAMVSREIQQAPADTPWKQALYAYAMFMGKGERIRAVFWTQTRGEMVTLEKQADGAVTSWKIPEPVSERLLKIMQSEGFTPEYVGGYPAFERIISASRLSPQDIARALR